VHAGRARLLPRGFALHLRAWVLPRRDPILSLGLLRRGRRRRRRRGPRPRPGHKAAKEGLLGDGCWLKHVDFFYFYFKAIIYCR
jgi:hypothetical protein